MKKRIQHPHPVWRVTRLVTGVFLVVLGTVSFLIPILPNWLFIIPGLGLLAPESRHIRKLVVWLRARLRLRRFRKVQRRAAAEARQAAEARGAAVGSDGSPFSSVKVRVDVEVTGASGTERHTDAGDSPRTAAGDAKKR